MSGFILGIMDIVASSITNSSGASIGACQRACNAYVVAEILTVAFFCVYISLVIRKPRSKEWRRAPLMFVPAVLVCIAMIVGNTMAGVVFSIDASHQYVAGPANFIIDAMYLIYIAYAAVEIIHNREEIEFYKIVSAQFMVLVAVACMVLQAIIPQYRLAVFCYTFVLTEMYLSFQIPENRFDTLTGLLTKNAFDKSVRNMLDRKRDGEYLLIYSNIKEFKAVNGLYGQEIGDEILAMLGHELKRRVHEKRSGIAGRLQSDHFALCVNKETFDLEGLLEYTSDEGMSERLGIPLHVFLGIYSIEDKSIPVSVMCDRARLALADIADSQVKQYAYYKREQSQSYIENHEISADLERSIRDGCFEVYIQPIFELHGFKIVSGEALVRWNHPERGLLAPGAFIPLFESNGLISKLDEYVWRWTCDWIRARMFEGRAVTPVSVNISRADISPDLAKTIIGIVDEYELPTDAISFEITESAYAECREEAVALVSDLHEHGFSLLLDDFGSGYSSLCMLEQSGFDTLKIDRQFLDNIMTSSRSRTIAGSMIELANGLGMSVITEGIESQEQARLMRSLGSGYAQGFYFSKPRPISDFELLLDAE